jgi:hypothetical protein
MVRGGDGGFTRSKSVAVRAGGKMHHHRARAAEEVIE